MLTVATYNVLANAYIKPSYYPHVDPTHLDKRWRTAALKQRIAGLNADVICLQEVERRVFEALQMPGYTGVFTKKKRFKPDGCAIFVRGQGPLVTSAHHYTDKSGHLVLTCRTAGIGIATSHLKWNISGEQSEEQMRQMLDHLDPSLRWVVCGDFNVLPDSKAIALALARGFTDGGSAATCNPNGKAKRVDYILAQLPALHENVPPISDTTPLPCANEPSDHLPVVAKITI